MFTERTIDEVLAALRASPGPRTVATDADGTLWATDVGDELFLETAARGFEGSAREALRARAAQHLDAVPDDDPGLARALMKRYAAGHIAIGPMCDLQAEALGERSEASLRSIVEATAVRAAATVRPEVRALLTALRAEGWRVHVVTGSLGEAVAATMDVAGIPWDTVDGGVLAREGGRVRGALAGAIPLFEGKVRALAAAGAWPATLGLGDGGWDVTFLRDVALPVLVHPKPALREAMQGHPRAVVLR